MKLLVEQDNAHICLYSWLKDKAAGQIDLQISGYTHHKLQKLATEATFPALVYLHILRRVLVNTEFLLDPQLGGLGSTPSHPKY